MGCLQRFQLALRSIEAAFPKQSLNGRMGYRFGSLEAWPLLRSVPYLTAIL